LTAPFGRFALIVLCGFAATLAAQQPAPAFEVASVKPNASGEIEGSIGPRPGGYAATNIPLRLLIIRAYELRSFQVAGGPGWIDGERFDVTARAPEGTPPNQVFSMLRTLLAERFKLVAHTEKREQPVYALVTARADGRLGPKLKASTLNCAEQPSQGDRCAMGGSFTGSGGTLKGVGQPLSVLATHVSTAVDRIVQDRTGLAGGFDFELAWSGGGLKPTAGTASELPSVFTALQEQLGLKLEPWRGPVEVLVIDSAERPTPD
jgi:uncharacterized protein (TIGR03435 family)